MCIASRFGNSTCVVRSMLLVKELSYPNLDLMFPETKGREKKQRTWIRQRCRGWIAQGANEQSSEPDKTQLQHTSSCCLHSFSSTMRARLRKTALLGFQMHRRKTAEIFRRDEGGGVLKDDLVPCDRRLKLEYPGLHACCFQLPNLGLHEEMSVSKASLSFLLLQGSEPDMP